MKIAMVGYGKMGKEIVALANDKIDTLIDPHAKEATGVTLSKESLKEIDVCIDFTHPSCALKNIQTYLQLGIPAVIGTTGWYEHLPQVREWVKEASNPSLIYAPNFSIGVNLFFKILRQAARVMNKFDTYDVAGFEAHHRHKADTPSGTGAHCGKILLEEIDRKQSLCYDVPPSPIPEDVLHFPSMRCGMIPGTHTVHFDSAADSLSLTHAARGRTGFALGALQAAEWVVTKKGLFTMDDLLTDIGA